MDKSKPLMIVIIALLVLVLAGVGALAYYTMFVLPKSAASAENPLPSPSEDERVPVVTVDIKDTFKTNLSAGSDGKEHAIVTDISFAVTNSDKKKAEEFLTYVEESDAVIKANVLNVIRSCTVEEVSGPDALGHLSGLILDQLKTALKTEMIVDVYIKSLYVV